jgi:hypothetical protein
VRWRARSWPLTRGRTTSELGLPLGLGPADSMASACSVSKWKAPRRMTPWKEIPSFSSRRGTSERSTPVVRLTLMLSTFLPLKTRCVSAPLSKPIMETWTVAPFRTQSLSDQAMKMSPVCLVRLTKPGGG